MIKNINKNDKIKNNEKPPLFNVIPFDFPKAICLEHCKLNDVSKEYYKDVLDTLKAFSNSEKFNNKKPHPIKVKNRKELTPYFALSKKHGVDFFYSLDVRGRKDNYRLLYCIDKKTRVHKILHLCTDDTHKE